MRLRSGYQKALTKRKSEESPSTSGSTGARPKRTAGKESSASGSRDDKRRRLETPATDEVTFIHHHYYYYVDKDILAYMQLVQAQDLQEIWDSNGVKISVATVGDCSNIEFLPNPSTSPYRPKDAIDQFRQIYSRAEESTCQKIYDLRRLPGSLPRQWVEEALRMTRIYHSKVPITWLFGYQQRVVFIADTTQACDVARQYFCAILRGYFDEIQSD